LTATYPELLEKMVLVSPAIPLPEVGKVDRNLNNLVTGGTAVNVDLEPDADNTLDLGTDTYRFRDYVASRDFKNKAGSNTTLRSPNLGANTTAGGKAVVVAGAGGTGTTGGTGGDVELTAGDGKGTGNNKGGDIKLTFGKKANSGDDGKLLLSATPITLESDAGNNLGLQAGNEGANTTAGADLTLDAGDGGTDTTGGAGGSVKITAGDAKGTGNNAGGDVKLSVGAKSASGADGKVLLSAVDITVETDAGKKLSLQAGNQGANTTAGVALALDSGDGGTDTTGGAGGDVAVTAGDAKGSGNNNGGSVVIAPGALTGTGLAGAVVNRGMTTTKKTADVVTTAGAENLTINRMRDGIYDRDPNGGARTDTTDTAADIVGNPGFAAAIGDTLTFYIVNVADAAEVLTIAGGTGVTVKGDATIAQNESRVGVLRMDNVTASSEACTLYLVG